MTVVTAEDLAAVALPRTGYRPAVEYLAEALRGQGKAIATTVDTHLTNAQVLNLAGAIDRAVAKACREQLAEVAEAVLAMQVDEVDCEAIEAHGNAQEA